MAEHSEAEQRAKLRLACTAKWNAFIVSLLNARKQWEEYIALRVKDGLKIEEFSLEAQKVLYLANPHGEFDYLVEDLITHKDLENYLKTLIIK